ncbi:MAG: F420-dependent methylenetetrahydromethanopterin dehydrogenase [Methanothrix sp.]
MKRQFTHIVVIDICSWRLGCLDEHRYLAGSERMHFSNPYARAKAVGALHMAQTVAGIDAAARLPPQGARSHRPHSRSRP